MEYFIKKCQYNRLYDETMRSGWGIFYKNNGLIYFYTADSQYQYIRETHITLRSTLDRPTGRPLRPVEGSPGWYTYRSGNCRLFCPNLEQ